MSEVKNLEKQLKDAKLLIERRDDALKLYNNPEFKKIVLDGFFIKDCARYAQESQDPALNKQQQEDALHIAQAAGHFKRYLSMIVQLGNHAEYQLNGIEDAINEVSSESED